MVNRRKELGTAQEKRVVQLAQQKGLKASKQPQSGVLKDYPSDAVIEEEVLVECKVRAFEKTSAEKSVRVEFGWLDGVREKAQRAGMSSAVLVVRPKGTQKMYAVLDYQDYLDLLKIKKDHQWTDDQRTEFVRLLGQVMESQPDGEDTHPYDAATC